MTPQRKALLAEKQEKGHDALQQMEQSLSNAKWLVSSGPTLADIALYPCTSGSGEGGIYLENYPNIRNWLRRIEALPGFIPMAPWKGTDTG